MIEKCPKHNKNELCIIIERKDQRTFYDIFKKFLNLGNSGFKIFYFIFGVKSVREISALYAVKNTLIWKF